MGGEDTLPLTLSWTTSANVSISTVVTTQQSVATVANTLTLPSVNTSYRGVYTCTVNDAAGTVQSSSIGVNVTGPCEITGHRKDKTNMHLHTYIHIPNTRTHIYTHVHTCTRMYAHMHTHAHICARIHTCTHIYTQVHKCTHMYIYMHTHAHTYACIYTHTCTYIYTHVHACSITA